MDTNNQDSQSKSKKRLVISFLPAIFMFTFVIVMFTVVVPTTMELSKASQKIYLQTIDRVVTSSDWCDTIDEQMYAWKKDIDDIFHLSKQIPQENYDKLKEKHDQYCI